MFLGRGCGRAMKCPLVPLAGLVLAAFIGGGCGADDGSVTVARLGEFEVAVRAGWRIALPSAAAPQDQDINPVLTVGPEGSTSPEGGLGVFRNPDGTTLEVSEASWRARLEDAELGSSTTRRGDGRVISEFEGSRADRVSGETRYVLVGVIMPEGPSPTTWVVYCDARVRDFLKNCREFIDGFVPLPGAET